MRPVRLTPRLQAIADAVSGETLADIGTDHAYLPAYLLQNGKIARAIAADLRAGPLARAKVTARDAGCADRMDFRLCDGLRGLRREEADTVVIAGMGGETITHILAQAPWTDWTGMQLLLQPMSTQPELRRWLWENGFVISWEKLVQEGDTLYVIQGVEPGREKRLYTGGAVGRPSEPRSSTGSVAGPPAPEIGPCPGGRAAGPGDV